MSDKKKSSGLEKLLLGAVIGAAVGSVIGASVAPDSGKKTRAKLGKTIQDISSDLKQQVSHLAEENEESRSPESNKKQSFLSRLFSKFKN